MDFVPFVFLGARWNGIRMDLFRMEPRRFCSHLPWIAVNRIQLILEDPHRRIESDPRAIAELNTKIKKSKLCNKVMVYIYIYMNKRTNERTWCVEHLKATPFERKGNDRDFFRIRSRYFTKPTD